MLDPDTANRTLPNQPLPVRLRLYDRLRLLAAAFLVFDAKRLGWRLATRTIIGLLLPLTLARQLDMPALTWLGIGAYLLAIGDSMDDGDRLQPIRLAVGAVFGGLALATGILAGGNLILAVSGMLLWGVVTGLMGVCGNAFATMGLPIAWAYVTLGLPSRDHSLANAAELGALFRAWRRADHDPDLHGQAWRAVRPIEAQDSGLFSRDRELPRCDQSRARRGSSGSALAGNASTLGDCRGPPRCGLFAVQATRIERGCSTPGGAHRDLRSPVFPRGHAA